MRRWADRSPDLLGLACFESLPKESLHYAVFERVERDHDEAPAGGEALKPYRESSLEIVELIVDGDAQGLEDARRRMNARLSTHGRRDTLLNDSYKLCRCLDGMTAAGILCSMTLTSSVVVSMGCWRRSRTIFLAMRAAQRSSP
jgi:hypothetical protein